MFVLRFKASSPRERLPVYTVTNGWGQLQNADSKPENRPLYKSRKAKIAVMAKDISKIWFFSSRF